MNHIHELKFRKSSWINIDKADAGSVAYLRKAYGFLLEDLKETLPPIQRAKLVERPNYLFVILLFPYYDRATKKINIEEFKDKVYKDYCNICGIEIIEKILEIANSNQ